MSCSRLVYNEAEPALEKANVMVMRQAGRAKQVVCSATSGSLPLERTLETDGTIQRRISETPEETLECDPTGSMFTCLCAPAWIGDIKARYPPPHPLDHFEKARARAVP